MKKTDLEELPLLDVRQLSPTQLQAMSDLFAGLVEAEFEPLPGMGDCPSRRVLSLPDLGALRTLLASEPVVSNQRL